MSLLSKTVFLLAFSSFIHAQDETWLSVSTITLGLSVSTSQAAIDAKDESGVVVTPKTKVYSNHFMDKKGAEINEGIATIKKTRFSNLEFLRNLVRAEKDSGRSRITSVVGWSLVYIYNHLTFAVYTIPLMILTLRILQLIHLVLLQLI